MINRNSLLYRIKAQHGQSTIEGAVMSLTLLFFISFFFLITYCIYASYWTEHILYESMICYEETNSKSLCQNEASHKIASALPFHKESKVDLRKIFNKYSANVHFVVPYPTLNGIWDKRNFKFEKSVRF